MRRKLDNWIDGFVDYCEHLPSAEILKRWSAIACVAGAMERKTWVTTYGSPLYPNMYIMLLAPPGIGKSILSSRVGALWRSTDNLMVGSSSLTKASLVDELDMAERNVTRPNMTPAVETFNSLQLAVNELGTLITAYDQEFMTFLTDVYDCGGYSERRRSSKIEINIERVQLTLFGSTTPSWLGELMPEGGWDQGFISRVNMIYSGYKKKVSLFANQEDKSTIWKNLSTDLNTISNVYGEFSFDKSAAEALDSWQMAGNPPEPDHPKLQHYNSRRTAHVEKMMMVASIAESDDLILNLGHFQTALEWLLEAEHYMPDIFKAMSTGGDMKVIEDCWFTMFKLYLRNKREPVREYIILQFLQERLPAHNVERVLQIMVKSRMFEQIQVNKVGVCYRPLERR